MKEDEEQDKAIRRLLWGMKGADFFKGSKQRRFSIEELLEFLRRKQGSDEEK
jgi:hypothetical protein